jgi:hypothetical protein
MYVEQIDKVKNHLSSLKGKGLIDEFELPYENLLTRLSAAIFFITPAEEHAPDLWDQLNTIPDFSYRENSERNLSQLKYRVTFNQEEKEKNNRPEQPVSQGTL